MLREIKKNKLFFGLVVIGLFLSFTFNVFGTMPSATFTSNFKDSETLVANQVICNNSLFNAQLIVSKDPTKSSSHVTNCTTTELEPYSSQFGLQGKTFTIGFQAIHKVVTSAEPEYFIVFAQLLTALASALLFALIALWVKVRFGLAPAIVVGSLIALSPMLVGFGRNLYWMLPLMIAPLVFVLYYFQPKQTFKKYVLFWIILGALFYIRYLCGYEYLTSLTLMAFAPVVYFLYLQKSRVKEYVKYAVAVVAVSVVAFAAALFTHIAALTIYTGSIDQSIERVSQRVEERTVEGNKYTMYPYGNLKVIAPSFYEVTNAYIDYDARIASGSIVAASLVSLATYLLIPVVHLPLEFNASFGLYLQSTAMFIIVLAALFITRKRWVAKPMLRTVNGLYLGALVGIVAYCSWLVLAFSHSLVHAHINGILLYLPFALFGYTILGLFVQSIYRKIKQKSKK